MLNQLRKIEGTGLVRGSRYRSPCGREAGIQALCKRSRHGALPAARGAR